MLSVEKAETSEEPAEKTGFPSVAVFGEYSSSLQVGFE